MAPSHYINQCWNIVILNIKNKLRWNLQWNSYIFIQENAFENGVCEMATVLSQPQCVKQPGLYHAWRQTSSTTRESSGLHQLFFFLISDKNIRIFFFYLVCTVFALFCFYLFCLVSFHLLDGLWSVAGTYLEWSSALWTGTGKQRRKYSKWILIIILTGK